MKGCINNFSRAFGDAGACTKQDLRKGWVCCRFNAL